MAMSRDPVSTLRSKRLTTRSVGHSEITLLAETRSILQLNPSLPDRRSAPPIVTRDRTFLAMRSRPVRLLTSSGVESRSWASAVNVPMAQIVTLPSGARESWILPDCIPIDIGRDTACQSLGDPLVVERFRSIQSATLTVLTIGTIPRIRCPVRNSDKSYRDTAATIGCIDRPHTRSAARVWHAADNAQKGCRAPGLKRTENGERTNVIAIRIDICVQQYVH